MVSSVLLVLCVISRGTVGWSVDVNVVYSGQTHLQFGPKFRTVY